MTRPAALIFLALAVATVGLAVWLASRPAPTLAELPFGRVAPPAQATDSVPADDCPEPEPGPSGEAQGEAEMTVDRSSARPGQCIQAIVEAGAQPVTFGLGVRVLRRTEEGWDDLTPDRPVPDIALAAEPGERRGVQLRLPDPMPRGRYRLELPVAVGEDAEGRELRIGFTVR